MPFGGTVTTFTPPETTASLSRLDRKRNNSVVHPGFQPLAYFPLRLRAFVVKSGTGNRQLMSANIPAELKYAKSHEWVRVSGDTATVGITDHAQHDLTDVAFVELPAVGRQLKAGET